MCITTTTTFYSFYATCVKQQDNCMGYLVLCFIMCSSKQTNPRLRDNIFNYVADELGTVSQDPQDAPQVILQPVQQVKQVAGQDRWKNTQRQAGSLCLHGHSPISVNLRYSTSQPQNKNLLSIAMSSYSALVVVITFLCK